MLASQNIKVRLQYRFDFFMGVAGMIIVNLSQFFFIWLIFGSVPVLAGWSFYEIFFLHGFVMLAGSFEYLFFDHLWQLNEDIMGGVFTRYYLRPMNMLFYYMAEVLNLKAVGYLIVSIGGLVYAGSMLRLQWGLPEILLFLLFLTNASVVSLSIDMIIGFMGFWFRGTIFLTMAMGNISNMTRYPMTIYGRVFRFLFTFVLPYAFIGFYPVQILLRSHEINPILYASPLVGVLLFSLAYLVWKKGVDSYSGTGT